MGLFFGKADLARFSIVAIGDNSYRFFRARAIFFSFALSVLVGRKKQEMTVEGRRGKETGMDSSERVRIVMFLRGHGRHGMEFNMR